MFRKCSACFQQSPMNLIPLFYDNNGKWESTRLSGMIEQIFEKKINRACPEELFVCHDCIRELNQVFYNYPAIETQKSIDYFFERPIMELPAESWMIRLDDIVPVISERGINGLPEKCLLKIFKYISINERRNLETVCTRWKNVVVTSYKDLHSVQLINPKREVFLKLLNICSRTLQRLSIKNIKLESLKYFKAIGPFCSSLTHLSFQVPQDIDDNYLRDLFSTMEKLDKVELHFSSRQSINLQALFNSLRSRVKKISLIYDDYTVNMDNYLDQDPCLHNFDNAFNNFTGLTDVTFKNLSISDRMMRTITQMDNLYSISFEDSRRIRKTAVVVKDAPNTARFTITHSHHVEALFRSLLKHCIRLRYLIITDSIIRYYKEEQRSIDDVFFQPHDVLVVNCCEFLVVLEISRCNGNVDLTTEIIPKLFNLKKLKLNDITLADKTLQDLSVNCPLVWSLDLEGCVNLTGEAFSKIWCLKKLLILNLGRIFIEDIRDVDESIFKILTHCLKLKELTIFPSRFVCSDTMKHICKLKDLKILGVSSCTKFNDDILINIVKNLKKLHTIDCSNCVEITKKSVAFALEECLLLKHLDITNSGASRNY
ncbi:hypothetical protein HCN44_009004 [Aphidius gifuensis]|uniref:F-box domain-containing protein n=1 Tax=Aphidius gifuensis TaxID=684658 RepID=A0A834XSM9_APHGI|nr:hypothetical protein HCN44_009004 [Aphidius gifuensis]